MPNNDDVGAGQVSISQQALIHQIDAVVGRGGGGGERGDDDDAASKRLTGLARLQRSPALLSLHSSHMLIPARLTCLIQAV